MESYSVPNESHKLLFDGIIGNKLHSSAPAEIKEAAAAIEYVGSKSPSIPINWRFAESVSALKGFQGSMLNVLLKKKYGTEYQKIVINTDHAQLFIMSVNLTTIDPLGENLRYVDPGFTKYFPDGDIYRGMSGSQLKSAATNIYKAKDGRFYHLHASMNASPVQEALGVDQKFEDVSYEEACKIYQEKMSQHTSEDVESLMNDKYRQAGTRCWSTEEYKATEHGKANAHVGLFEIHHIPNPKQEPTWWKTVEGQTGPARPLFGLKVLDLTRVIAAPTLTRELAELGASVLRITSPNVTDMTILLCDLAWGKWNAHLDLKKEANRAILKSLIEESDIVVDGYRPGVMAKWGFGKEDILGFFKDKNRGVVYVHENCYGWNGPWSHRSGWQQISDANCGVSLEFGRAMGNDEPVTPVFPNSDYCTGAAGATGVLQALIEKAEKGGSFVVDVALNYYSQWLVNSCSTYSPEIWDSLWGSYGRPVFRHTDNMFILLPRFHAMLAEKAPPILNPSFFEIRENRAIGVPERTVKPVLVFPEGLVKPGYNIGARGNGVDYPKWPDNLLEEIIAKE